MRGYRSQYVIDLISAIGGKLIPYMRNEESGFRNVQIKSFSVIIDLLKSNATRDHRQMPVINHLRKGGLLHYLYWSLYVLPKEDPSKQNLSKDKIVRM